MKELERKKVIQVDFKPKTKSNDADQAPTKEKNKQVSEVEELDLHKTPSTDPGISGAVTRGR